MQHFTEVRKSGEIRTAKVSPINTSQTFIPKVRYLVGGSSYFTLIFSLEGGHFI